MTWRNQPMPPPSVPTILCADRDARPVPQCHPNPYSYPDAAVLPCTPPDCCCHGLRCAGMHSSVGDQTTTKQVPNPRLLQVRCQLTTLTNRRRHPCKNYMGGRAEGREQVG